MGFLWGNNDKEEEDFEKETDFDSVRKELNGSDELLIEKILYEDKEKYGRIQVITTRFLRKRFGSDKVDRAIWRIQKRNPAGLEQEQGEEEFKDDLSKFNFREFIDEKFNEAMKKNTL